MPDSTSVSDISDHHKLTTWNTDPLDRPQWLETILRELPKIVDHYTEFILTYGHVLSGKFVGVPTVSMVNELKAGTMVLGTERQPSTVRNATPAQLIAAALLPQGDGCPIARPASLSAATDIISDDDKDRYSLMPERCRGKDGAIAQLVISSITNNTIAADYDRRCCHSWRLLVRILQHENEALDDEAGQAMEVVIDGLFEAGLADANIPTFNSFLDRYLPLNNSLPRSYRKSDALVAGKLVALVKRLGNEIKSDLKAELHLTGATGDLTQTVLAINKVLGNARAESISANPKGADARAFGAFGQPPAIDPRKGPTPAPAGGGGEYKYHEGLGACRWCGQLGHLHRDCPKKPKGEIAKGKKKTGKAKKAASAALDSAIASALKAAGVGVPTPAPAPAAAPAPAPAAAAGTAALAVGSAANTADEGEVLIADTFFSGGEQLAGRSAVARGSVAPAESAPHDTAPTAPAPPAPHHCLHEHLLTSLLTEQ